MIDRSGRRVRIVAGVLAAALVAAVSFGPAGPASATSYPSVLTEGQTLKAGAQLVAPGANYRLLMQTDGNLVVYGPKGPVWWTGTRGSASRLVNQSDGNLVLYAGTKVLWRTNSVGSGTANKLSLLADGALEFIGAHGTVWTDQTGYGCGSRPEAHGIEVSISHQVAYFCSNRMQILVSWVTTGASSLGDGTPTGTWQIQAKVRDTHLYPAGGGVYYVHYWMPYNGAYGMHDSPWQTFAYGSQLYKTQGSHGCVHLPGGVAAWVFGWAPVGTTVSIRS